MIDTAVSTMPSMKLKNNGFLQQKALIPDIFFTSKYSPETSPCVNFAKITYKFVPPHVEIIITM